jgi:hypothetical protein
LFDKKPWLLYFPLEKEEKKKEVTNDDMHNLERSRSYVLLLLNSFEGRVLKRVDTFKYRKKRNKLQKLSSENMNELSQFFSYDMQKKVSINDFAKNN